jgi:hypothetical protein
LTAGTLSPAHITRRFSDADETPRFIARQWFEEEFPEDPPLCLHISGGWLAVPIEWFDGYDLTTFNREEMEESINAAWKRFDRDND